jgi:hypothetical protein
MDTSQTRNPKPGESVVLLEIPPGLVDGLPSEDQEAIVEAVGKPVRLNDYDEIGRAELEFTDRNGVFHRISVRPQFIAPSA